MNSEFEWDREKADANLDKHGVTFEEAASVFFDPLSITIDDPKHSVGERRYVIVGHSILQRILVVVHTDRGDMIRIISARTATPAEKRNYERE
ncbi:MAG: BrnT family toxin [Pyrinomonadaceae bacterium]